MPDESEIERLKAENASLLGSLREKELYAEEVRLRSVDYAQQLKESRAHAAAAEQRAEAAEKALRGLAKNRQFGPCDEERRQQEEVPPTEEK